MASVLVNPYILGSVEEEGPGNHTFVDADAEAFSDEIGTLTQSRQEAVDQLALDLKAASLWSKMIAIYPFIGGTATAHSLNLKNIAEFDITWGGTVTHNASGITGNGTDGYGDTGISPSAELTSSTACHLSLYSLTDAAGNDTVDMGARNGSSSIRLLLRFFNAFFSYLYSTGGAVQLTVANSDSSGFFLASRRSNSDREAYKDGASIVTNTGTDSSSPPTANIFICAYSNAGTPTQFSGRTYAFASFGDDLNDSEAAAFYTCVQDFQTALGREV